MNVSARSQTSSSFARLAAVRSIVPSRSSSSTRQAFYVRLYCLGLPMAGFGRHGHFADQRDDDSTGRGAVRRGA
jgi:hypothetical protein